MIEAEALAKTFPQASRPWSRQKRALVALQSVSFSAEDGRITGLLGANGAGKSTTMRILATLVHADRGRARVDGFDVRQQAAKVRQSIAYLPHNSGIYPRLTTIENIVYYAEISGLHGRLARLRAQELIELLDMGDIAGRRTDGFSQGQRTKVALARAMVHRPKTLILDEPSNGLDVLATRNLRTVLRRLRDEGHCILLSSHIMQEIAALCDEVAVIHDGIATRNDSLAGFLARTGTDNLEDAFVTEIGRARGVQA